MAIAASDAKAAREALAAGADLKELMAEREPMAKALARWLRTPAKSPSDALEMLGWLEAEGLPMSPEQCYEDNQMRGMEAKELSACRMGLLEHWASEIPFESHLCDKAEAMGRMAARWAAQAKGHGGLDARECLRSMVKRSNSEIDILLIMAPFCEAAGAWPSQGEWIKLAEIGASWVSSSMGGGERFASRCAALVGKFDGKLGAEAAAALLAVALGADSLPMMAAVARRAEEVKWSVSGEHAEALCCGLEGIAKEGDVSALAFSLGANRRKRKAGAVTGRECHRALAKIPEAVEAALAAPAPSALAYLDFSEIMEIHAKWPQMLRSPRGNVLHAIAERCGGEEALAKFGKALGSPLAGWLSEARGKPGQGLTPVDEARMKWSEAERAAWEAQFAKWESGQVRSMAARGKGAAAGKGKRRL